MKHYFFRSIVFITIFFNFACNQVSGINDIDFANGSDSSTNNASESDSTTESTTETNLSTESDTTIDSNTNTEMNTDSNTDSETSFDTDSNTNLTQCAENSKKCEANSELYTCVGNQWVFETTCDNICSDGACMGPCDPTTKDCISGVPHVCDSTGNWISSQIVCPVGCAGGECQCEGSPSDVRLWKLHLGQQDYAMLKNIGDCPVQLEGMVLFLDDTYPSTTAQYDCTIGLPTYILGPGKIVRVHENPVDGDIGAMENKVFADECAGDFSYNPQRGGASYLCDGACSAATVIDLVVHDGYTATMPPPALLYGQSFDAPLEGITDAGQDSTQYRRVATSGVAPSFLAADWAIETRYVYADFEAGINVEVDGAVQNWNTIAGQEATIATDAATAAIGSVSLKITHNGNAGISDALSLSLNASQDNPTYISYYVLSANTPTTAGYFDLLWNGNPTIQASFEATGLGTEIENNNRTQIPYLANQWYQVEFREIDWTTKEYDLYINRIMIDRLSFWANALFFDSLRLYSVESGSVVYFDGIQFWR